MAARVLGQTGRATWDVVPVTVALAYGVLLLAWPSIPLIAIGLWWIANTISHHFIHRPFFRTRSLNIVFSCWLSLLLGLPQSLWRARHLAHLRSKAGQTRELKLAPHIISNRAGTSSLFFRILDCLFLAWFSGGSWSLLPAGTLRTCSRHGQSLRLVLQFLLFNDGYHIEHHLRPSANWRELPHHRASKGKASRWPAVLRWLEVVNLCAFERMVLRFPTLQHFVLKRHEAAFRSLLRGLPPKTRIGIVGGGLFPRTAMILRGLLPEARLTLIDQSEDNLSIARRFLFRELGHPSVRGSGATDAWEGTQLCLRSRSSAEFINKRFEPATVCEYDLLVIPLAFEGDRRALRTASGISGDCARLDLAPERFERGRLLVAPQVFEHGDEMKALALLGVLIIAKLAILAGRPIQLSGWMPFAYFWQDVLVALAFALFDSLLSRLGAGRFPGWPPMGDDVYVAINVPVARGCFITAYVADAERNLRTRGLDKPSRNG
jgi:hypothetical protein